MNIESTQIGLVVSAVILACGYAVIFAFSVNKILEAFSDKAEGQTKYYKIFGLCAVGSFIIYCIIFAISYCIYTNELENFIKNTNDKIFSVLFTALIIQFLSFLFSRQNYDYQSKLANNKAKADRIEGIIKNISGSIISRALAMFNVIEFQTKQAVTEKRIRALSQKTANSNTEEVKKIEKLNSDINIQETLQRIAKLNEENANWQIGMISIESDFTALGLTPMNKSIKNIASCFEQALNHINGNDLNDENNNMRRLAVIQGIMQTHVEPHRVMIATVLLTMANATRTGKDILCPSEKQLDDFMKFPSELEKWVESTKR